MNKKWTALLLLLLIIMMLTPMALAGDRSDVIPWVYHQDPDSAEALHAETLVQPIDYEYSGDVSFIVKDAYFDGETLAIAIQFKTNRPLYLINEDAKLDGEWIDYHTCGTSLEETFVGHAASPQRFSPIEDVRAFYYELSRPLPKGEEVDVTINFTMLTPKTGVEIVEAYRKDNAAMWAQIDAIAEKGHTPIANDSQTGWNPRVLLGSACHDPNCWEETDNYHGPLCDEEALVQYANMEVIDHVELTFPLTVR